MPPVKRRVRTSVKVVLAIAVPIFVVALAFSGLGLYVHFSERILPNVSIAGVDVSRLTHGEAVLALDLRERDLRGLDANVTILFPDSSELKITGEDVRLFHDARHMIDSAYSERVGRGFIMDAVTFLQRLAGESESFEVGYDLDIEFLRARVAVFTANYNNEFEENAVRFYDDRIVIVKGAGQVSADEYEVFDLAYEGLFESLYTGLPVSVTYSLPESKVNTVKLASIRQSIRAFPVSAEYDPETRSVTDCAIGVDFDVAGAKALLGGAESGESVTIEKVYIPPEITRAYMESFLFRDLIGECTTHIAGSANRLNNIVLASAAVDGHVLAPGEEFSFNQVVGRRTHERGYRPAPALSGGQVVQANGGGVCQVSSAIHSAIMDSDLQITERFPHGRPVAYLPRGRDAAVSWGTLDFRFVNNTEFPLRIDAEVEGRTLTVQVSGTIGP